MWDELKGMFEELKNRISSPFMSSFLISWILWNHKLVMVLLSGDDVEKKWYYMEHVLYPSSHFVDFPFQAGFFDWLNTVNFWHLFNTFWFLLIAPLMSVWFYHFCYPYMEVWFYKKHLNNIKSRNDITEAINMASEIESLKKQVDILTDSESTNKTKIKTLMSEYSGLETKYTKLEHNFETEKRMFTESEKEVGELTVKNTELNEKVEYLSQLNESLKSQITKSVDENNELTELENDMLISISNHNSILKKDLFSGENVAHKRLAAKTLINKGYVREVGSSLQITTEGDTYIVDNI